MNIRSFAARVALIVVAIFTVSCASNPARGRAGQIAEQGLRVAQTLGQIQQLAVQLQQTNPAQFPAAKALQFQEAVKKAANYGAELANVLRVIDSSSRPAESDVSKAIQIVNQIVDVAVIASSFVGDAPGQQIRDLLVVVLQTTNTILVSLGKEPV